MEVFPPDFFRPKPPTGEAERAAYEAARAERASRFVMPAVRVETVVPPSAHVPLGEGTTDS